MFVRNVLLITGLMYALAASAGPPSHANPAALHATETIQFSEYALAPSASGALGERNVIVWEPENGNCYVARLFFTNTEEVKVNTPLGPSTPDQIFVWQMACGNSTTLSYVLEYIYAVPEAGFEQAEGVQIREDVDGDGAFEFDRAFGYRFKTGSDSLAASELVHNIETYKDEYGGHIVDNNWTQHIALLGESLTVNNLTFDDVAVAHFQGFGRIRFLAKGIGAVREVNGSMNSDPRFKGQSARDVIFYRDDGVEAGNLPADAPFAGVLEPWFQAP